MIKIIAYQIAENTNLKKFKIEYAGALINSTSFELFYRYEQGYIFVLNYGVVVFANVDDVKRSSFISLLLNYCTNNLDQRLQEDFIIAKKDIPQPEFSYNYLSVKEINDDVIRIAMLQVAQSLALDFYQEVAQHLFDDTVNLTNQLETYGKLKISKRNLLKFIGKTLNTKTLTIQVIAPRTGKGATSVPPGNDDQIFITGELDRETAYPGQQVTWRIRLYTQLSVEGADLIELPDFNGFYSKEKRRFDTRVQYQTEGGKKYAVKTLHEEALFPQEPKELTIGAAKVRAAVESEGGWACCWAQGRYCCKRNPFA